MSDDGPGPRAGRAGVGSGAGRRTSWSDLPVAPSRPPSGLAGRERILWLVARDLYHTHFPAPDFDGRPRCTLCHDRATPCRSFVQAAQMLGVPLPAPMPRRGTNT